MKTYPDLMQIKSCNICFESKPLSEFSKTSYKKVGGGNGIRAYCKACELAERRDKYQTNKAEIRKRARDAYNSDPKYKAKRRNESLRYLYGLTLDQYNEMRIVKKYRCAICGIHESQSLRKKLYIDHCHDTKKIRGLLCVLCNTGLGSFADDTSRLATAMLYLTKHKN